MWAIIKMQARSYFGNPSWFFAVLFPIIMLTVLGSVFTNPVDVNKEEVMLTLMGNVIVISVISSITFSFGQNFMELKDSAIIKRLGATDISKSEAMTGFMLWTTIITISQVIYIMLLTLLFTNGTGWLSGDLDWGAISWIGFLYGMVILILVSFTITFLFISLSRTNEIYGLFGFMYFILTAYFGGLIFPGQNILWMNVLSLFLPHTYVAHFFAGAMNGGTYSIPVNDVSNISIWDSGNWSWDYVQNGVSSLNIYMPWVFSGLTGYVAVKNFKWD